MQPTMFWRDHFRIKFASKMKAQLLSALALVLLCSRCFLPTKILAADESASKEKTNTAPTLTNSVLFEIDGAATYLKELKKQGQLPGVPKSSHATITTGEQPASELKELRYPFTATFLVTLEEDSFTNHYIACQPVNGGTWELMRAWRTDPHGRTVKQWAVASVPKLKAMASPEDLPNLAAMQQDVSSHATEREPMMREFRSAAKYLTELGRVGGLPGIPAHGHEQVTTGAVALNKVTYPFTVTFLVNEAGESFTNHYSFTRAAKDASWRLQKAWRTDSKGQTVREWSVEDDTAEAAEQSKVIISNATENASYTIPFRPGTDELNAALFGRECAVIWFASESKTFKEETMNYEIATAAKMAKALGVSFSEDQFRDAFQKREHKQVIGDFDSTFPETLTREKGAKIRDIYLFSFWCTAARNYVQLVPLWKTPKEQDVARHWVTMPLAKAGVVADPYASKIAPACHELTLESMTIPLDSFDQAREFAGKISKVERGFLSKYLTADQVEMVVQPFLKKR